MSPESLLVALGGNALILHGERGYIGEQFSHADACMRPVAALISQGMRVAITHGNGPIVGNILLRNECAKEYIPPMPLYICVADSQGGIGAMIEESLQNELRRLGIEKTVSAIITHVLVDINDPEFKEPTKPIGPYYSDPEAREYMETGWRMRMIPGRGWRRIVPSPKPERILEMEAIKTAFEKGIVPIAAGGGGIPLTEGKDGLRGVDAVIDKDLSASLLAGTLGVERFIILTDVDSVYLDWESDHKERIERITAEEAKRYLSEGQFPPGSMGPKIEAAVRFLESGGKEVIITNPENLTEAMGGSAGTRIIA